MAFKEWRTEKEILRSREINALAELIEQAEGLVNNDIPTPEEMAVYLLEHGVKIELKKHFTPEEVRQMTNKEVRANYQAIMDSMDQW